MDRNDRMRAFLAALIKGDVSQKDAEQFVCDFEDDFPDDTYEAVSHYVDDFQIREKDLGYEIWMRITLLSQYVSLMIGEPFSIEQFVCCLACRLGCRYNVDSRKESKAFCITTRTGLFSWNVEIEFFAERVRVVVCESSLLQRPDCNQSAKDEVQLYDGTWLGLDFLELRRVILSGDFNQMKCIMESCRVDKGVRSSSLPCHSDIGGVTSVADACAMRKGNDGVGDLLTRLISGDVSFHDVASRFEQLRDAIPDSVRKAISGYIDNADTRKQDLPKELSARLLLLEEYVVHARGEKFSLKQYVQCLACRLGCRFGWFSTRESVCFWVRKRSWFRFWNDTWFLYWSLKIEFFMGRVRIEVVEGPLFCRSRRKQRQLYDGPWMGLDFDSLRKSIINSRYGL